MSAEEPVLELQQGRVRGAVTETVTKFKYFQFKGIPYAKPPVGDLRFKAPQPPEPWKEVLDATKGGKICAQLDRASNTVEGEEDCLVLNVYTPAIPAGEITNLPVMFFLHGGGFIYGNGMEHGPDYIMEQNVVVVSINYRLGVLGFLCLDTPEAQGNMGLKDQVQALKWVRDNITKFGGDPDNVTVFGISAGAVSVEYLQLSPMAKGLFHKAILQSGSTLNPWARNTKDGIIKLANRIAKLGGKEFTDVNELLKYLKELPVQELVAASVKAIAADEYRGGIHFGFVPTIESTFDNTEAFLTEEPYRLLKGGEFNKVPNISGFCSREGLLLLYSAPKVAEEVMKEKKLAPYLPFNLDDQQRNELEKRLRLHYMDGSSGEEEDEFMIDFFTDIDFLGGVWVAGKLKALAGAPTYLYEFCYDGKLNYLKAKLNIQRKGACHGDDTGYIFKRDGLPTDISEDDELVRERMVTMWTNFSKYGEPTPEETSLLPITWEAASENEWCCLEIDSELTIIEELYVQRLRFFEHLYDSHWP